MKKEIKADLAELINKLQEQMVSMDRKIDTLLGKISAKPAESMNHPKQNNGFKERVLYKAVCADCKKECEVPFKPSGERPIYCKECFSKRKPVSSFRPGLDNRPSKFSTNFQEANKAAGPLITEKKKMPSKKSTISKRKKK